MVIRETHGYLDTSWILRSVSIPDTHTCNKLYPVFGYCLRILASFRRHRRAFLFWVIHIGNLVWVDAGFWVDHMRYTEILSAKPAHIENLSKRGTVIYSYCQKWKEILGLYKRKYHKLPTLGDDVTDDSDASQDGDESEEGSSD